MEQTHQNIFEEIKNAPAKSKWLFALGGIGVALLFILSFILYPNFIRKSVGVSAADNVYTWSGAGDGTTWASDANWDGPAGYPADGDDKALIGSATSSFSTPGTELLIGELELTSSFDKTLTTGNNLKIVNNTYYGNTATTVSGDGSLTIAGGQIVASGGTIGVYGTLTQSGGTIDMSSNTLLVNTYVYNSGTYDDEIKVCSSYTDASGGQEFSKFYIDGQTLTLHSNLSISGDIYYEQYDQCAPFYDYPGEPGTLVTNGYNIDVGGDFPPYNELMSSQKLNASAGDGGDSTIYVGGNWYIQGDYMTAGSSEVVFDGTVYQTISGGSTFNDVTISNTSTNGVLFQSGISNVTINGTLTIDPSAKKVVFGATMMGSHAIGAIDGGGLDSTKVEIVSSSAGSPSSIDITEASPEVENVTVSDNNASAGSEVMAINSIDGGGNTNWVFVQNDPDDPSSLAQKTPTGTVIPNGGTTTSSSIVVSATLTDTDAEQVQLCVETKQLSSSFTNTEDSCGTLVNSGSTGSVTVSTVGTQALSDGSYHWQVRAKDSTGRTSGWVTGSSFVVSTSSDDDVDDDVVDDDSDDDTGDTTGGGSTGGTTDGDTTDEESGEEAGKGGLPDELGTIDETLAPIAASESSTGGKALLEGSVAEKAGENLNKISSILGAPFRAIGIPEEFVSTSYGSLAIIVSGASGLAGPISNSLIVPSYIADAAVSMWNGILVFFGFRARRKKNWGRIIEAGTGMPVTRAVIRVIRHDKIGGIESKKIFATTKTDNQGDYRFVVPPGRYSLDVEKRYYEMMVLPQAEFYKPRSIINITSYDEGLINKKIALSVPQGILSKRLKAYITIGRAEKVVNVFSYCVLVFGSIVAINGIINSFSGFNLFIAIVYVLLWALWIYNGVAAKKFSPWGETLEAKNKAPIDLVLVRILNKEGTRVVRTIVTDAGGKYSAILRRSKYQIKATKSGYLLEKPLSVDVREDQDIVKRKIFLNKT